MKRSRKSTINKIKHHYVRNALLHHGSTDINPHQSQISYEELFDKFMLPVINIKKLSILPTACQTQRTPKKEQTSGFHHKYCKFDISSAEESETKPEKPQFVKQSGKSPQRCLHVNRILTEEYESQAVGQGIKLRIRRLSSKCGKRETVDMNEMVIDQKHDQSNSLCSAENEPSEENASLPSELSCFPSTEQDLCYEEKTTNAKMSSQQNSEIPLDLTTKKRSGNTVGGKKETVQQRSIPTFRVSDTSYPPSPKIERTLLPCLPTPPDSPVQMSEETAMCELNSNSGEDLCVPISKNMMDDGYNHVNNELKESFDTIDLTTSSCMTLRHSSCKETCTRRISKQRTLTLYKKWGEFQSQTRSSIPDDPSTSILQCTDVRSQTDDDFCPDRFQGIFTLPENDHGMYESFTHSESGVRSNRSVSVNDKNTKTVFTSPILIGQTSESVGLSEQNKLQQTMPISSNGPSLESRTEPGVTDLSGDGQENYIRNMFTEFCGMLYKHSKNDEKFVLGGASSRYQKQPHVINSSTNAIGSTLTLKCYACDNASLFLCSGCRKTTYCSPRCQRKTWLFHQDFCSN